MSDRPTEVFVEPRLAPVLFCLVGLGGSAGLLFLFFGAGFEPRWNWISVSVLALTFLVCLGFAVEGIRRLRRRVTIGPAGIRFGRDGVIHPWGTIARLESRGLLHDVHVIDLLGADLGVLSSSLGDFRRALLLASLSISYQQGEGERGKFVGGHGTKGWLLFLAAVVFVIQHFIPANDRVFQGPGLGFVALFLAMALWKVIAAWRGTGDFVVTVDREGVGFAGRAGRWSARWGEISEVRLETEKDMTGPVSRLVVALSDGPVRRLQLPRTEIHGVLSAIREFGGQAAKPLIPTLERPPASLLKRGF